VGLLTGGIFGVFKAAIALIWLLFLVGSAGRKTMPLIESFGIGLYMYAAPSEPPSPPTTRPTSSAPAAVSPRFFFYRCTACTSSSRSYLVHSWRRR